MSVSHIEIRVKGKAVPVPSTEIDGKGCNNHRAIGSKSPQSKMKN